jgi:hypothetical protein
MREIEARNIHASAQQAVDNSWRAAGGADGANNFRMAKGHLFGDREIADDME